ncbi:MAG: hypothetical protein GWO88_01480 [Planctomycetia bacterium]|nr:hypothetical protein [Planctomycetia bacterium]
MSEEERSIRLVLQQGDVTDQSASIDPFVERQRHCFDNISAARKELTLSFQWHAGFWRDGFIHLYRIALIEQRGETNEELLHFDDPDEILEACQFKDLHYRHSALGEVFVITGPNPSLLLPLPDIDNETSLRLCIELSAPYSLDYAIAQDGFIREENAHISRIRELEDELGNHREYKQEIEEIKRSKAWKLIEGYRQIYARLAGWIPSVREKALTVMRADERQGGLLRDSLGQVGKSERLR